jgi:hypothetical protein
MFSGTLCLLGRFWCSLVSRLEEVRHRLDAKERSKTRGVTRLSPTRASRHTASPSDLDHDQPIYRRWLLATMPDNDTPIGEIMSLCSLFWF